MAHAHKFDPANLDKLRDPDRLESQNPDLVWARIAEIEIGTVVDIGAGLGFFAVPFSRRIPQGVVYACDLLQEMVNHMREALRAEKADNVFPLRMEEVRVPLRDGIADVVFMANLHHELERPMETLAECRRLLRAGGRLAIIDWKRKETPHGPPVEVRVAEEKVIEQLNEAGFSEVVNHPILPHHYFLIAMA